MPVVHQTQMGHVTAFPLHWLSVLVSFVVWEGSDPSTNVVLLEDIAALLGLGIAASCMGISYYTGGCQPVLLVA